MNVSNSIRFSNLGLKYYKKVLSQSPDLILYTLYGIAYMYLIFLYGIFNRVQPSEMQQ